MAHPFRPDEAGTRSAAALVPPPACLRTPADLAGERGGFAPWCGPAAVARAADLSYAAACALLHAAAPDRYPQGAEIVTAWWRDLLAALDGAGIPTEPLPPPEGRPTLCRLVREGLPPGWYLVRVTGHFLLLRVHGFGLAQVFDNRHHGAVLSAKAHGRCRVTHAARITGGPLLAGPAAL
jgi:hypothetical protein